MIFFSYFISGLLYLSSRDSINNSDASCHIRNSIYFLSLNVTENCLNISAISINQLFINNVTFRPKNIFSIDSSFKNIRKINIDGWPKLYDLINVSHMDLLHYNQTGTSLKDLIENDFLPESIELLNLNNNQIRKISFYFFNKFKSLQYLYLDSNKIFDIDFASFFTKTLKFMSILNNSKLTKHTKERIKNAEYNSSLTILHDANINDNSDVNIDFEDDFTTYSSYEDKNFTKSYSKIKFDRSKTRLYSTGIFTSSAIILVSLFTVFIFCIIVYFVKGNLIRKTRFDFRNFH